MAMNSPVGLLKMYCTRSAQDTARDAVQIFGGRGITKSGMGRFIEHVGTLLRFTSGEGSDQFGFSTTAL